MENSAATAAPQTASSAVPTVATATGADATDECTDWTALAALMHVLKPKISFHYTDAHGQQQMVHSKLFNAVICNPSSTEVVAAAHDRQLLLPAKSAFCMSDLKAMQPFVAGEQ